QSRPKPGPSTQLPGERFGGQVATGPKGWRVEPGWRPGERRSEPFGYRDATPRGSERERGARPGYRPGASGGWRSSRGRGGSRSSGTETPPAALGGPEALPLGGPGEIVAPVGRAPASAPGGGTFQAGEIADRGPVERGTLPPIEPRARDSREF